MKKVHFYFILICIIMGCNSTAQEATINYKDQFEKYNFQYQKTSKLSVELQDELFIPFLENGKYYISDYNGNRISKQAFDEIFLFYFAPFFMVKIKDEYFLYSFPDKKLLSRSFNKKLDINNFRRGDAKGYNNKLVVDDEEFLLPQPYIDNTSMDFTKRKKVEIQKLIDKGVLKENSRMGNHIHVYKFNSDEFILKLNDNLEVVLDNKSFFMDLDNFNLEDIPAEIRPQQSQLKQPTSIQEYYVLNDGKHGHVFTCDGKYLSSHRGRYNEFFSLNGPHRKLKHRRQYIPIGEFNRDGKTYYVRLSDGLEYRK